MNPPSPSPHSSDPLSLGISTPERVALELPIAGVGSRSAAYLIDASLIFFVWTVLYFLSSFAVNAVDVFQALSGLFKALAVLAIFAGQWIYWTASEVFMDGQTFGKRIVGIRVVREDGSPVTFLDSALRNLLRVVDFLPGAYALGLMTMLATKQNRRIGDLVAGTLLIRVEKVDLDRYMVGGPDVSSSPSAARVDLSASDTELIVSFLERAPGLAPDARLRLARSLLTKFGTHLTAADKESALQSWEGAESALRTLVRR